MKDARSLALVLSEMDAVMDRLIGLSCKKQEILVAGDAKGLERLLPLEQELVANLDLLEEERMATTGENGVASDAVGSLRESLRDKAKRITLANERNRALLKQGLEVVQYGLKLLSPEVGYGNPPSKGPLVFDHRV